MRAEGIAWRGLGIATCVRTMTKNATTAGTSEFPHFGFETKAREGGLWPVAGIDEAGRGPLAGPVAAAAVILDPASIPAGLADSKLLDAARRESLFEDILRHALAVGIGMATAAEIDRVNIRQATFLAMRRAFAGLPIAPGRVLIDGRDLPPKISCDGLAIVDGDRLCLSIAAASIVAKVARDRMMMRLAREIPHYGFETHMGYATPAHREALRRHGPCAFHRRSFGLVKEFFSK